jgi:hypothetical protein
VAARTDAIIAIASCSTELGRREHQQLPIVPVQKAFYRVVALVRTLLIQRGGLMRTAAPSVALGVNVDTLRAKLYIASASEFPSLATVVASWDVDVRGRVDP